MDAFQQFSQHHQAQLTERVKNMIKTELINSSQKPSSSRSKDDCSLCTKALFTSEDLYALRSCSDVFHRGCLVIHLKGRVRDAAFPLACPVPACKKVLSPADLEYLLKKVE